MEKGLIKYKSLILNHLDENGISIFNLNEFKGYFATEYASFFRALKSLINDGFIKNIQKGLYCRQSFSNENVLAYYLAKDGALAYWTALHYHGLTTQFSNTIFVQTPKLIKSGATLGINYKFIKVAGKKAGQYKIVGKGNNKYAITTTEKTMVDCFDLMEYSAGWDELIKALFMAKLNSKLLIEACEMVGNLSVIKRLGYLIELMGKKNMKTFILYAKSKINDKYNLLDPTHTDKGKYNSTWRLRMNVEEKKILNNLTNLY